MDQEVSLSELEQRLIEGIADEWRRKGNWIFQGILRILGSSCIPIHSFNIALEDPVEKDFEKTTVRNQDRHNGDIMEQKVVDLSGNLEDFAEEQRSPVRSFSIALEDSVENGLERTTVGNPEGTTRDEIDVERDGGSLEHVEIKILQETCLIVKILPKMIWKRRLLGIQIVEV